MKILLAHNTYSVTGGTEVFYHEVGRVLKKNGHQVAYFSVQEPDCSSEWAEYFPRSFDYYLHKKQYRVPNVNCLR